MCSGLAGCAYSGEGSDVLHIFRVNVREALELGLVQIHEEETVDGRQLWRLVCELRVEVGDVVGASLKRSPTISGQLSGVREEEGDHKGGVSLENRW